VRICRLYVNIIFQIQENKMLVVIKIPLISRGFSEVRVTRSLVLCVCFLDHCLSFVLFILSIVLSVLRFTASDYLPLISSNVSYKWHNDYVRTLYQNKTIKHNKTKQTTLSYGHYLTIYQHLSICWLVFCLSFCTFFYCLLCIFLASHIAITWWHCTKNRQQCKKVTRWDDTIFFISEKPSVFKK
jgi:hypothetical protein